MYALSGIRTHDPNVRTSENISCLRPRAATLIVGSWTHFHGIKLKISLRLINLISTMP
jgi:hypothetical protein